VRRITKAALAVAATVSMTAALAGVAAGPAAANYPPPTLRLLCTAAANNGTLESFPPPPVCALPSGQTTAPNSYSATVAVRKTGVAATITFTVTAGSLPPGLTLPASAPPGTSPNITGNPTKAGTFNFTIKAAGGGLTATLAYQITITVQGPPDQLVCSPSVNGGFLENGVCLLPDAVTGQSYQGHLVTSHQAGGTLSVVSGALPPGLTLPATFTGSGDIVGGTPSQLTGGQSFTVRGTGDQGQPLYQAYSIAVDDNTPLSINTCCTTLGGTVGQADSKLFYLVGGAAPYTWSLASGQFPPGMTLQTFSDPRDANDELAGTPTTAGTYTFTMRLADFNGQQATQKFTFIVVPPLQVTNTTLPAGTVGVPYSRDLDLNAQGGNPPYSWFVVNNISELPPGLTLDTTAPDFNNVLAGTPTQAGTFSFPMQVQDSQDNTVNATLTITINP
jgi:large repetitive protein